MDEKSPAPGDRAQCPVRVASFAADERYRLVSFDGSHWEPMEREEFEARIRTRLPGIDPHDTEQVVWEDRPWEWPAWHPGEA